MANWHTTYPKETRERAEKTGDGMIAVGFILPGRYRSEFVGTAPKKFILELEQLMSRWEQSYD